MNFRTLNVIRNLKIPDNQLQRCEMLFADVNCNDALYCTTDEIDGNQITVYVENGGWQFVFDRCTGKPTKAHPQVDMDNLKNIKLLWIGKCCPTSKELYYNEAIKLIVNDVKNGISFSIIGKTTFGAEDADDLDEIPF